MSLRAKLIQLFNRETTYVRSKDIWRNGNDNHYPERIARIIRNSPTANRAKILMSKFIAGKGLVNDIKISENEFLSDLVTDISEQISIQGGFYLHRSIKLKNGKFTTSKITLLNPFKMRIGKTDDNGLGEKYWQDDYDYSSGFGSTKKAHWYYPFSNDPNVIEAQIANDYKGGSENIADMLSAYRGQVLYVKVYGNEIYSLSPFDSVYDDCDTDYRISLYSNKVIRSGFLGKKMILTQGLSPEDEDAMEENLKGWLGAENSSNIYYANLENVEDLEKAIVVKEIPTDYSDDMFVNTQERIKRNILGAANNAPEALIFSNDGGIFSGSGEQIKQLKNLYSEQTESERTIIERSLKLLGYDCKIISYDTVD